MKQKKQRGSNPSCFICNSFTAIIHCININIMKYRVDAYKNGAVRQGTKLLSDIDEAIKLAYAVANHYKCYTRIARV